MQDAAYEAFRREFEKHQRGTRQSVSEDLKLRDKMIAETELKKQNLLNAVANGDHSPAIIAFLNQVDAELTQLKSQREAAAPAPVELPDDLPVLYRAYVDDVVQMLSEQTVRDRAADALRELISEVRVRPRTGGGHIVELEGKLLEMLAKAKPAGGAGFASNWSSFELVAGA